MKVALLKEGMFNLVKVLQKEKKGGFLSVLLHAKKKVLCGKKESQSELSVSSEVKECRKQSPGKPFQLSGIVSSEVKEGRKRQVDEKANTSLPRHEMPFDHIDHKSKGNRGTPSSAPVGFDHIDHKSKARSTERDRSDIPITNVKIFENAEEILETKHDFEGSTNSNIILSDERKEKGIHISEPLRKSLAGTESLPGSKRLADPIPAKENVRIEEKSFPRKGELKDVLVAGGIKTDRTPDNESVVRKKERNVQTQKFVKFKYNPGVRDVRESVALIAEKVVPGRTISEKEKVGKEVFQASKVNSSNIKKAGVSQEKMKCKTEQNTGHILKVFPESAGKKTDAKGNINFVSERKSTLMKEKAVTAGERNVKTKTKISRKGIEMLPIKLKKSAMRTQKIFRSNDTLKLKPQETEEVAHEKVEKTVPNLTETGSDTGPIEVNTRIDEKSLPRKYGEIRKSPVLERSEVVKVKEPSGGEASKGKDNSGNELGRESNEISLKYEEKGKLVSFRELTDGRVHEMITRERAKSAYPVREMKRIDLPSVPKIVEKMYVQKQEKATINLEPPGLGKLEITITKENNDLKIVFKVQSEEAKHILEHEVPKLVDRFNEKGLHAQVYVERKEDDDYLYQESNSRNSRDDRREQRNGGRRNDEKVSFEEFFEGVKT
ncbi:flagellar hook-length control protein FliK [Thermotoga sp.]|uniref:flagellar hook-length control protein FliK n=1 Tax=Thermotoga sp. TaxID=28240 RepID=UPI0025E4E650|nr:flagellar hook-length control protein FliK [Thermotoga sp.]MCD6551838.1 flagellar hook-length control protein FliK [Thermotoga sp.]